jgi:hypothetical protein
MADEKKGQPRPQAAHTAISDPPVVHEQTVSQAKTSDPEPVNPNMTMASIEAHLFGLYTNQGKTAEEAKKLAKAQAAAMSKG